MAPVISLPNVIYFLSYLTPFLIGLLIITIGFVNGESVKSLIYIAGALIAVLFGLLLRFTFFTSGDARVENPICSPFSLFMNVGSGEPPLSTIFMVFSFFYTLFPMLAYKTTSVPFIILMSMLLAVGVVPKLTLSCNTWQGTIYSMFIGVFMAGMSYLVIHDKPELVFFSSVKSNRTYCSKPSKNTFKCSVYKNGQLITQT